MPTQNLDALVDVQIQVSPLAAPRLGFDQLLIVGISTVISTATRLVRYASLAEMITAGFLATDDEYLAAQLYFGQSKRPNYVWIGRMDDGVETALEALTACRVANSEWYTCMVIDSAKTDHIAIAAYVESVLPSTVYAFTTADADVPLGTAGNVFETLMGSAYSRTFGIYSTNSAYDVCAILGYAMGAMTGLANSAYTLKFKQMVGVPVEDLTSSEIGIIAADNGNVYVNYANYYNVFQEGIMANGQFFDEIINLDMLKNNIQLNVMDLLYGNPKVPQTEAGVNQLIQKINEACDISVTIGFLGAGTWTGSPILNLNTGDPLPAGFLVQATSLAAQSTADRQARKSPNIYVAVKEAGAMHSILIGVYVDR